PVSGTLRLSVDFVAGNSITLTMSKNIFLFAFIGANRPIEGSFGCKAVLMKWLPVLDKHRQVLKLTPSLMRLH
ncbi:MAG: hypothetical protein LJE83_06460, partial [Gammaproteobacteria bacterium]|nr:hypothetical protein [Gammaproteobacteria bacterium]